MLMFEVGEGVVWQVWCGWLRLAEFVAVSAIVN